MTVYEELATTIVDEFENLLDDNDITIPDEDRTGDECEARLYSCTYYGLVENISNILEKHTRVIINPLKFNRSKKNE